MSGVLLGGEGVASSSQGARVEVNDGKVRVIDGPFAEAKELIAGFAILEVDSLAEGRRARAQVRAARRQRAGRRTQGHRVRGPSVAASSRRRPPTVPRPPEPEDELEQRLATLWRVESPRVIARLMRQVGDLDTAEELAQDVFVAAVESGGRPAYPTTRPPG